MYPVIMISFKVVINGKTLGYLACSTGVKGHVMLRIYHEGDGRLSFYDRMTRRPISLTATSAGTVDTEGTKVAIDLCNKRGPGFCTPTAYLKRGRLIIDVYDGPLIKVGDSLANVQDDDSYSVR